MGILNSIALGKSRKSAGNVTFYSRIGVSCFRQKPVRSPGYKSSVPQRMQQSVFRFMKANVDASGVKSFVDTFYDAKPRKNKSETKNNMFYRSFMPHLVANKQTIYELPVDDMNSPALFLGTPETNQDKLTNGQLGVLTLNSASLAAMTIDEVSLNQIIDKANTLISVNDTPYTINNLFVGVFGAAPSAPQGYKVVQPTNVVPTLADGLYSFNLAALTEGISATTTVYVALMVAGVDSAGGIDLMRRKFATDSAVLGTGEKPIPTAALASVTGGTGSTCTTVIDNSVLAAQGVTADILKTCDLGATTASEKEFTISNAVVANGNMTLTLSLKNGTGENWNLQASTPGAIVTRADKKVVVALTNSIGWTPVIE